MSTFDRTKPPDPDPNDIESRVRRASPDDQLWDDIEESLEKDPTDKAALEVLEAFKRDGGSMEVAITTLRCLMRDTDDEDYDEDFDERICCLLDVFGGFCSPGQWIWLDAEYPIEVPVSASFSLDTEKHEKIIRWSERNKIDWCMPGSGFCFRTEADAEAFRKRWL